MTLIVEDGSGKVDAESYLSVADAATRLARLGYTAFSSLSTDAEKEACLRFSTEDLDRSFYSNIRGCAANESQSLAFPRSGVYLEREYSELSVPEYVLATCAIGAENNANDMSASSFSNLPAGLKRVTLADGVDMELHKGGSTTTPLASRVKSKLGKMLRVIAYGNRSPFPLLTNF